MPEVAGQDGVAVLQGCGGDGHVRQAWVMPFAPGEVGKPSHVPRYLQVNGDDPGVVEMKQRLDPLRQPLGLSSGTLPASLGDAILHLCHCDDGEEKAGAVAVHPGYEVRRCNRLGGRSGREDIGVDEVQGSESRIA